MKKSITTWTNERVKVSQLKPFEFNPRTMTEAQDTLLGESLRKIGYAEVIFCNHDYTVIGGHQRLRKLVELGATEVDIRRSDKQLEDADMRELNIRDNKNVGTFDWAGLFGDFTDEELSGFGVSDRDLERRFEDAPPAPAENDAADPVSEAKKKFDEGEFKQIVLLFLEEEYGEAVEKIGTLSDHYQVSKPADLVKLLIEKKYDELAGSNL